MKTCRNMIYHAQYNPDVHHRRSIRLKGYDYSQKGAYFVTVCTRDREWLFGEIVGGEMVLNDMAKIVQTVWNEMPKYYTGTKIDKFVIMPNHVHGIIIVGAGPRACPDTGQPQGVAYGIVVTGCGTGLGLVIH